jgi:hypothetical protein
MSDKSLWYDVPTEVVMNSSVKVNRLSGRTHCLLIQGWRVSEIRNYHKAVFKLVARLGCSSSMKKSSSKMSVDFHRPTRRYTPEYRTHHTYIVFESLLQSVFTKIILERTSVCITSVHLCDSSGQCRKFLFLVSYSSYEILNVSFITVVYFYDSDVWK